jgi:hypothetical protein
MVHPFFLNSDKVTHFGDLREDQPQRRGSVTRDSTSSCIGILESMHEPGIFAIFIKVDRFDLVNSG